MLSLMMTLSALAATTPDAPQPLLKRLHKPGRPPVVVQLAGPALQRAHSALARETLSRPCSHSRRLFE